MRVTTIKPAIDNKITKLIKFTRHSVKTVSYTTFAIFLAVSSLLPGAIIVLANTKTAFAATPPDSCFSFNSGTQTIEDYYDNENNDINQPACTRDVDIPAVIGGIAVTTIGNNAFREKRLTCVTIPNSVTNIYSGAFQDNELTSAILGDSVTTINDSAFWGNLLTSITIPNSVTSIGGSAFNANMLETVTLSSNLSGLTSGTIFTNNKIQEMQIPDSITLIDTYTFFAQSPIGAGSYYAFMNNDYSALNQYMATSWYARLFTSPGNPNNLTDSYAVESVFGMDMNSDGDLSDSIGGHLINPAHITASYKDEHGNAISPSQTFTGVGLNTYLIKDNVANDLGLYYKAGGSYSVPTAPIIAGYEIVTTPSNIASLSAGDNPITYVYKAVNNNSGNDSDVNNSNDGSAANLTTPTSPISAFSLRPVSISTPTGTNISSSSTVPELSLSTQDPNNQYPLGLVDFSFTTNQTDNQVSLAFVTDLKPNQVTARKYSPNTNTYTNLPTSANVSITETTKDNQHALQLTYTITDNGELDLDPTTGIIKDPVGLAVTNATYNQLTNTGNNNILPAVMALSSIIIAGGLGIVSKRANKRGYYSLLK